MTIHALLQSATASLATVSTSPARDAELLLAAILQYTPEQLFLQATQTLTPLEIKSCNHLLRERLTGKSVAAILGRKLFYGLEFEVNAATLIPRPDTEVLVDAVLDYEKNIFKGNSTILDIGTGSGCIAIALAKHLPNHHIAASDISPSALTVAQRNAAKHHVNIHFYRSDLLDTIPEDFHIIAANLPYIPTNDPAVAEDVAAHEPHTALYSGEDGLDSYRTLFDQLTERDTAPNLIACEIGRGQATDFSALVFERFDHCDIDFRYDLAGIARVGCVTNML